VLVAINTYSYIRGSETIPQIRGILLPLTLCSKRESTDMDFSLVLLALCTYWLYVVPTSLVLLAML
jgi:hypothetical protein